MTAMKSLTLNESDSGSGSGSALPTPVLVSAGVCTLVAVLLSAVSIYLQLKNYRKPLLQRMVVRIMIMIPIYSIASLISLFSLEAAFVIDAIRDIYEAFVIYCFFSLLLSYLGGERSLLILLHGRPLRRPPFPVNIFKREVDVSDPYTFLFIKRGIIQYVQIKPILAAATLILKAFGKYNEGDFRANSGYLYVSVLYNVSICLALYCLAMFWLCVSEDLKPFRPVPKFLCVKGILFFSFWQSILISTLVAANVISRLGPYTDAEHISVGLNDTLICIEMPFFALAHLYAFLYTDFIDPKLHFCARMHLRYAFMDAFGVKDVAEDIKDTLRGEGMDYREFEPAEGVIHQGSGRDRRIKAGLRYSNGGKKKYWLPKVQNETRPGGRIGRIVDEIAYDPEDARAPLLGRQAENVVHLSPDMLPQEDVLEDPTVWDPIHQHGNDDGLRGYELPFGDVDPADDELFSHSRKYVFGDYNYPVIDVSDEGARITMWHEEERVLRDERGAWQSPIRNVQLGIPGKVWEGYGAVGTTGQKSSDSISYFSPSKGMGAAPNEVKIRWAHGYDGERGVGSSLQVPNPQPRKRGESSASSSSASSPNKHGSTSDGNASTSRLLPVQPVSSSRTSLVSPPTGSSTPSSSKLSSEKSRSKAKHPTRSPLPPDAVDLVVEDPEAGLRDRRKVEPRKGFGVIEGFRKVYRKGLSLSQDDEAEHGEETSNDSHSKQKIEEQARLIRRESPADDERKRELGERRLQPVGPGMNDYEGGVWERDSFPSSPPQLTPPKTLPQEEVVVARAATPPPLVRMAYDEMDDHNPWA
ncbi:hypothetical protein M378DRAFT_170449 [Amanita muscaria Koide BX008]|uniref:DUF300-domain-containing protein n=1 Tax=Amanita muscaria (strain Koide BX008) TaxID=946122 RepID=A0A0C2WPD0_AMAMK|nr:hypothetical protein M378DRAFT_170449 [Amanita muscaria Koide BX008]